MREGMEREDPRNNDDGPGGDDGDGTVRTDPYNEADEDEGYQEDTAGEVDELRDEVRRLNDRHLRLAAEFDNYRKRVDRERQTLVARLQADLVASLLDVIDDLERVVENSESATTSAVVDGVKLVEKKFRTVLGAAGLEVVDAEGEPFDPSVMEAMAMVPTDDPAQDHMVADVFQRGYRFGEVLVRPARVRVLSYEGPSEKSE
jgi:molecular chaperone GrpE